MRKIPSVLVALLPWGYLGSILCMFFLDIDAVAEAFHLSTDEFIFAFLALYLALGILLCILYALCKRNDNLFIKLSGALADIGLLCYYIYYWIETVEATNTGAMEAGLGVFLLSLIFIPYVLMRFFTAIACAASCARTARQQMPLHPVLHLIPIADLVSAFIVHKQLHK